MKIKILQSIAGHADVARRLRDFSFPPGYVVELQDELANALVEASIAISAKKSEELTMPVEVYTFPEDDPRVQAYEKEKAEAKSKAEAEKEI
ncbi:hypothetical protein ACOBR2_06660 [Telmatobacter bradus]|uniref:hypothetical protein n=1 Tax=Telmatobacter bradus TaxID=474953 RepID=UPI003B43BCDF